MLKEKRMLVVLLVALVAAVISIFLVDGPKTVPIAITAIIVAVIALFIAKDKL